MWHGPAWWAWNGCVVPFGWSTRPLSSVVQELPSPLPSQFAPVTVQPFGTSNPAPTWNVEFSAGGLGWIWIGSIARRAEVDGRGPLRDLPAGGEAHDEVTAW